MRELFQGLEGLESRNSEPQPTPVPDSVKRVLNHFAQQNLPYAYAFLLSAWLSREGVAVPDGTLAMDPLGDGSGGKQDPEKLNLGRRALEIQIETIAGSDPSDDTISIALNAPVGQSSSEIARVLLPLEYEKSRDAARKRIEEALKAAKSEAKTAATQFIAGTMTEDLLRMVLGGAFPLDSKLPAIVDAFSDSPLNPSEESR